MTQPQEIIKTLVEQNSETPTEEERLPEFLLDSKAKLLEILNSQYLIYVVEKTQRELKQEDLEDLNSRDFKAKHAWKKENSRSRIHHDNTSQNVLMEEPCVSNIFMNCWYSPFCTWVASIFQLIKDFNLRDAYV